MQQLPHFFDGGIVDYVAAGRGGFETFHLRDFLGQVAEYRFRRKDLLTGGFLQLLLGRFRLGLGDKASCLCVASLSVDCPRLRFNRRGWRRASSMQADFRTEGGPTTAPQRLGQIVQSSCRLGRTQTLRPMTAASATIAAAAE